MTNRIATLQYPSKNPVEGKINLIKYQTGQLIISSSLQMATTWLFLMVTKAIKYHNYLAKIYIWNQKKVYKI